MYGKRERERERANFPWRDFAKFWAKFNLLWHSRNENSIPLQKFCIYTCGVDLYFCCGIQDVFLQDDKMSLFLPPPFLISPIFCQRRRYSKWHLQPLHPVGALVLWLWEETHVPKVVGSNPGAIYRMYMTFFHIDWL